MLFEYDSEPDGGVVYCSSDSSTNSDFEQDVMDAAEEEMREAAGMTLISYASTFTDEGSLLRHVFPEEYESDEGGSMLDLRRVLQPVSVNVSQTSNHVEVVDDSCQPQQRASTTVMPPGSAFVALEQRTTDDGEILCIKLKESPATKKLKGGEYDGFIFALDPSMNRSQLKDLVNAKFSGVSDKAIIQDDNLFVGYVAKAAVGQGLLVVPKRDGASAVIERFKEVFPSTELLVPNSASLRPYYKEEKVAVTTAEESPTSDGSNSQPPQTGGVCKKAKDTVVLSERMNSATLLAQTIEAYGGIDKCRFVAFDCEAAIVLDGAIPLPLEFAFVDCATPLVESSRLNFHFFVHPGVIRGDDEITAMGLSILAHGTGHGIPYRNAAFLRRDYARLSNFIDEIIKGRNVILINKGSIMDVQALRWVYAAGKATRDGAAQADGDASTTMLTTPLPTPTIEEIPMFDFSALQQCVGWSTSADANVKDILAECGVEWYKEGACWYHHEMFDTKHFVAAATFGDDDPGQGEEALELLPPWRDDQRPHCARGDAFALAALVDKCLDKWKQTDGGESKQSE